MSSASRIVYAGNFKYPKSNAPGKRVYGNVQALESAGYEVTVLDSSVFLNKKKSFVDFLLPKSFRHYKIVKDELKNSSKDTTLILYGTCSNSIFSFLLLSYCKKNNIKLVADCVDFLTIKTKNPLFDLIKKVDEYLLKKISYKKYDGVLGISSYISNLYESSNATVVIPPLNSSKGEPQLLSGNEQPMKFVYSGMPFRKDIKQNDSAAMKDRLDVIIESFLSCESKGLQFTFDVLGLSKNEFLAKFPNFRQGLDNSKNICFKGMLPSEEAEQMFLKADFSVLLRDKKVDTEAGFPTKVVDSISAGIPVIVSPVGDIGKYLTDKSDSFFAYNNDQEHVTELFEQAINLSKDELLMMKKSALLNQNFQPEAYKAKLLNFINTL